MADPYRTGIINTNPDQGSEKNRYGSGFRQNFDMDPDPSKNYTNRIQP